MKYSILNGNNIEELKKLEDNSIDACITDPPYGMGMAEWDKFVPPIDTWREVYRVLKPGAFVLSFCSPELYHRMAVNVEDAGFRAVDMIFWIITTKMAKNNRLKPAHEPIMVAQKPLDGTLENNVRKWGCGKINIDGNRIPWEKSPPTGWLKNGHQRRAFGDNVEKAKGKEVEKIDANPEGRYPSNVVGLFDIEDHQKYFYAPRVTRKERGEYNNHPTPKPIDLMRFLVRVYSPINGIVIDPFMGSGSTLIASIQEQRETIGIELDKNYCDISNKRIQEHCLEDIKENRIFDY